MNDLVEDTLRHRAEQARLTPPDVGDVLDRVDAVRRRRRASLVSVACLVLVVLVVGLAQVVTRGSGSVHRPVADPALVGTGSAGPSTSPSAGPSGSSDIGSLAGVPRGDDPAVAYGYGLRLHLADGRVVDAPQGRDYTGWTAYAGGLLVADVASGDLVRYDATGRRVASYSPGASAAVSADGGRTAWTDGDDVLVGRTSGGTPRRRSAAGVVSVAGFLPGGALAVNAGRPLVVGSGSSRPIGGLRDVVSSSERTGLAAGTRDAAGDYAVVDTGTGRTVWRTSLALTRFSPDGRYVIALSRTSPHPRSVSVLDARSGRVVARADFSRASRTVVRATAWEDDTHLLLVGVDQRGERQAVLRLGVDGSLDRATGVTSSQGAAYVFARRP